MIYRQAPDEYLRDTRADPEWEWKAHPEVRETVRPLVAQEAKVASFLLEKGMALNQEAINLFLDAVEDNLLSAYVRLEALARGDYGADPALEQFPDYVSRTEQRRRCVTCWALFENWQAEVQPSRSTVARWTTVFKAADARFADASMITLEAAKGLLRNNLVTFLNASCSELWAGSDRRDPSETYGHWRGLQNKPLTRGESITGDARQEIPKLTIPPERDKIDSVIC